MLSTEALAKVVAQLPRKPRYVNDAPRTIKDLTAIVCGQLGGDASRLWQRKSAAEVKSVLCSIHGVGSGIASMAVLLIERVLGIRFTDMDHSGMDIKPDTHTVRVLYRLGLSESLTEASAVQAARRVRPSYPGEIDASLWYVGRTWCHASDPNCNACHLSSVCPKVALSKT